ncbi:MAG: hypothetical protein F6K00_30910 [Leptolyngbya sp. SIOISBB]|nr:hypothetical protein [Leptolyngbya sp. SIOISBB]
MAVGVDSIKRIVLKQSGANSQQDNVTGHRRDRQGTRSNLAGVSDHGVMSVFNATLPMQS